MKKRTKIIISLILPAVIILYFILCALLYYFEPLNFDGANLDSSYSFDLYKEFSKEKNQDCFIKQISANDIVIANDECLKYSANTIIVCTSSEASYEKMTSLSKTLGAEITGYIKAADFYQFTFSGCSYNELINKCSVLSSYDFILSAIPDYFEETPGTETSSVFEENSLDYPFNVINMSEAIGYINHMNKVNVGMIDGPVDYTNTNISVVNSDEYNIESILSNSSYSNACNHATHVAGIIDGKHDGDEVSGIFEKSELYSYNGLNNTLSYWIASICRMIAEDNVKVINISMGYNSYISISASLGSKNAIKFIEKENDIFSSVLSSLINDGNEFVICVSAGNENGNTLYKCNKSFFGYGDKKILDKFDFLNLFRSKKTYINSAYNFFLTDIEESEVKNRIIVVGSCDEHYNYSKYANDGDRVDIAAPGEYILSSITNNRTDYKSGTSMANAYVSGTAAMLFGLDKTIGGDEVKSILISTSTKSTSSDNNTYPVLNSGAAVKYTYENMIK